MAVPFILIESKQTQLSSKLRQKAFQYKYCKDAEHLYHSFMYSLV